MTHLLLKPRTNSYLIRYCFFFAQNSLLCEDLLVVITGKPQRVNSINRSTNICLVRGCCSLFNFPISLKSEIIHSKHESKLAIRLIKGAEHSLSRFLFISGAIGFKVYLSLFKSSLGFFFVLAHRIRTSSFCGREISRMSHIKADYEIRYSCRRRRAESLEICVSILDVTCMIGYDSVICIV